MKGQRARELKRTIPVPHSRAFATLNQGRWWSESETRAEGNGKTPNFHSTHQGKVPTVAHPLICCRVRQSRHRRSAVPRYPLSCCSSRSLCVIKQFPLKMAHGGQRCGFALQALGTRQGDPCINKGGKNQAIVFRDYGICFSSNSLNKRDV